jgi:hypothetical protein
MAADIAIFCGVFVAIFCSFLALIASGKESRATQEKMRARRLAEHRMNARLLRFNL